LGKIRFAALAVVALSGGFTFGSVVIEPSTGFGTNFPGTLLPLGTTEVIGNATLNNGPNDYIELQGLPALTFYTFNLTNESSTITFGDALFTDADQEQFAGAYVYPGTTSFFSTVIPADGIIIVDVVPSSSTGAPYDLTFGLPGYNSAPEPATLSAVGLGLIGLALRASRHTKRRFNREHRK
jgi:hypothetical protein